MPRLKDDWEKYLEEPPIWTDGFDQYGNCPNCGPEGCTDPDAHEAKGRADVVEEIVKVLEKKQPQTNGGSKMGPVMFDYPGFVRGFKRKP